MLRKYTYHGGPIQEVGEILAIRARRRPVLVQEDEIEEGNFLAASFFTSQVLSMEAIARTFKLLWRTRKGFEV